MNHTKSKRKNTPNRHKTERFKSDKPDQFFSNDLRKREDDDASIKSSDSDEYGESKEEMTAAERRKRLAVAFLKKVTAAAAAAEDGEEVDERGGMEARVLEMLDAKQLEESGRVRQAVAAKRDNQLE